MPTIHPPRPSASRDTSDAAAPLVPPSDQGGARQTAPEPASGAATDAAEGSCGFEEAYRLLGLARSTAAARRRGLELELDRETGAWRRPPDDRRDDEVWRQHAHLQVPEWGGNKPPGQDWSFCRRRCREYRLRPYDQTLAALIRAGAVPTSPPGGALPPGSGGGTGARGAE